MKYLRVKPECDNAIAYRSSPYGYVYQNILIGNELLTMKEFENQYSETCYVLLENRQHWNILNCFDLVEIPKTDIYWSFGCRFQKGTNQSWK